MPDFLTPAEVAEILRVPTGTLYTWRYKGIGPPSFKVGRTLRYDRADLESWIKSRQSEARPR